MPLIFFFGFNKMFSVVKAHVSIDGPAKEIINLTQKKSLISRNFLADCHSFVGIQKPFPKVGAGDTKMYIRGNLCLHK